jgi:predicted phosphoribosyltransferase
MRTTFVDVESVVYRAQRRSEQFIVLAEVCLEHHDMFGALGHYYRDFRQIADSEVIAILARFPLERGLPAA